MKEQQEMLMLWEELNDDNKEEVFSLVLALLSNQSSAPGEALAYRE